MTDTYQPVDYHRNNSYIKEKSQWQITPEEEYQCFFNAFQEHWLDNDSYWGLHLLDESPEVLGVSPCRSPLHISKFVVNQNIWHGYPVAYWLLPCNRPSKVILDMWQEKGYINRAKKSKIYRGQRCSM